MSPLSNAAILCDPLGDLLGTTAYDMPIQGGRYPFGTVATYDCGTMAAIVEGPVTRTCGGDGTSTLGSFNGTEPVCEGTYRVCVCLEEIKLPTLLNSQSSCVLIFLFLPMEK